jgi:hypothetical protein
MPGTWAATVLFSAAYLCACDVSKDAPAPQLTRADDAPLRGLHGEVVLLAPSGSDADSTFYTRLRQLHFDGTTESLFAADPGLPAVLEFAPDGRLKRSFGGRRGAGPGELRGVDDYAVSETAVAVLDQQNSKVLVTSRHGEATETVPLRAPYTGIAFTSEKQVLAVPSAHGGLWDVLDLDSGFVRAVGERASLPVRCDTLSPAACDGLRDACPACRLTRMPDDLFLLTSGEASLLRIVDRAGVLIRTVDLLTEAFPTADWHRLDSPIVAAENRQRSSANGDRITMQSIKQYALGFQALPDGRIAMPVAPSFAAFREYGHEFWILDPMSGRLERYGYPARRTGYAAATDGQHVFAVRLPAEALYRYSLP